MFFKAMFWQTVVVSFLSIYCRFRSAGFVFSFSMEIIDEFPKRLSVGILGSTGVAELPAGGATGMD